MRAVAVLAAMVFLLGAAPATPTVSEIVVTDCHFGLEAPGGPGLQGVVLKPDGSVVRVITPPGDPVRAPTADRTLNLVQVANVGADAYHALAERFMRSSFFKPSETQSGRVTTNARGALIEIGWVTTDTRGTLISVVRDSRRTTWSEAYGPADQDRATFWALYKAVQKVIDDGNVVWRPTANAPDPMAICESTSAR